MIPAPPVVRSSPLILPVGSLCRRVEPLEVSTSIRKAAHRFQEDDIQVLPILQDGAFLGVIEERDLIIALAGGWEESDSLDRLVRRDPPMIHASATGAEALRTFEATRAGYLAVVDQQGGFHGILTPSSLITLHSRPPKPRIVGGMATPFGVYLTNGMIGAGASHLSLILTGALLFSLFVGSAYVMMAFSSIVPMEVRQSAWYAGVEGILSIGLFLGSMRALPLAGIHAAEHMVVHAIEQGEELEPDIVSRMSRIHPRCGTNLAAAAMLFLGLFSWPWTRDQDLRLLVAFLATVILWRPLGSALQRYATTRKPTKQQIQMGIDAGKALLHKLDYSPATPPNVFQRLASSGMFHIVLGSLAMQLLLYGVFVVFNVPPAWRPF